MVAGSSVGALDPAASFYNLNRYIEKMKKEKKQGIDFRYLAKISLYELTIAILLGALPVAIYATNAKALDSITGALLASGELINHAGYLRKLRSTCRNRAAS